MDIEHRLAFAGIGLAAVALVVTQLDALPLNLSDLNPFRASISFDDTGRDQHGMSLMLEREFDVGAGWQLAVDVPDADVSIRPGRDGEASVRVFMSGRDRDRGREAFDHLGFEAEVRGTELTVGAHGSRFDRSESHGDRSGVGFLIEVTVPPSIGGTVSTGDGDISLGDLRGDYELETSDGDISVGRLSGSLYLRTSDGDVRAGALAGERISVRTSDGDVQIGALTGPAEISTSDGDIRVQIDRAGDLTLRTGDGDITIYADESLRADLDFSGESIDLGSGFTLAAGRLHPRGARGTLNGGGPTLRAHTGDGTISMRGLIQDR